MSKTQSSVNAAGRAGEGLRRSARSSQNETVAAVHTESSRLILYFHGGCLVSFQRHRAGRLPSALEGLLVISHVSGFKAREEEVGRRRRRRDSLVSIAARF